MVQLPHLGPTGKLRLEVKEEAVDAADAAPPFHGYKRSRLALQQPPPEPQTQQWSTSSASVSNQQSSHHGFLDEPSPLGLRLKKSPSLVDLIQMKLVQAGKAKDVQHGGNASASEKLKASNFPGSVLRIGSWEIQMDWLYIIRREQLYKASRRQRNRGGGRDRRKQESRATQGHYLDESTRPTTALCPARAQ